MNIKHNVIIALAAIALSSIGCAEEPRKRAEATELAPPPPPVFTSTLATTTRPEPVVVEVTKPAVAEEETAVPEEEPEVPEALPEPSVETIDGLTIQRFLTAPEVTKREPVDPTSTFFPSDQKVYAFVEVSNVSEFAKRLFVHFIGPEGKVSGGIELEIPAAVPRWRTWAYTRHFDVPGLWRVEIRDAEGRLLGALPFEVEAEL
jgi:hypothetical protein